MEVLTNITGFIVINHGKTMTKFTYFVRDQSSSFDVAECIVVEREIKCNGAGATHFGKEFGKFGPSFFFLLFYFGRHAIAG